jgi:hypothetical protein
MEGNLMNYKSLSTRIVLLVGIFPAIALGHICTTSDEKGSKCTLRTCEPSAKKGTVCTLSVDQIHPTQFAVGSVAVDCKADKISTKSKKKLKKYLAKEDHRIPAVVGPDGKFYMTDHHHLATALYRSESKDWGDNNKVLRIEVLDNLSDTSKSQFWEAMQAQNRSYNADNKGTANMNFDLLPQNVDGLLNDPYRTLSRWVRESCGYVKLGKEQCDEIRTDHEHKAPFFMEFYWGEFFRQKLPLEVNKDKICKSIPYSQTCLMESEVTQLKAIYDPAMKLAASPEAEKYFEDLGLNPWDFGFNPSGKTVKLDWSGEQSECDVVPEPPQ